VNGYKVAFDKDGSMNLFELVSGDDIVYWYNKKNYGGGAYVGNSELYQSCMADEDCEDYIKFYAKNEKVKMLILFEDDEKETIIGRALVWSLDEPEGRTFMDRIYIVHDHQEQFFINYAKKQGWLYKETQTFGKERIEDPKNQTREFMTLEVHDIKLNKKYPYLDTLGYLDQDDKILSTDEVSNVKLNGTDGEPANCEWSDKYKRWINMYAFEDGSKYITCNIGTEEWDEINKVRKPEDAVYLNYYRDYIPKELYDELIIKTTIGNEFEILKTDALYLKHYNGWATDDYIQNNMIYSDYEHAFYFKDDIVKSKYIEDYILKDTAVKVYTDVTKTETDYIPDIEIPFRTYKDGKKDLIMIK